MLEGFALIGPHKIRLDDIAYISYQNRQIVIYVDADQDPFRFQEDKPHFPQALALYDAIEARDFSVAAPEPDGAFATCERCHRVVEDVPAVARGADAAEFPALGDLLADGPAFYPTAPGPTTPAPGFPPTHKGEARAAAIRGGIMP